MTDISDLVKRLRALASPRANDQRSSSERFFEGYAEEMAEELKEAAATLDTPATGCPYPRPLKRKTRDEPHRDD